MEFDFVAIVDFTDIIARGCASTSWTLANIAIHHWMLALYDEKAQLKNGVPRRPTSPWHRLHPQAAARWFRRHPASGQNFSSGVGDDLEHARVHRA